MTVNRDLEQRLADFYATEGSLRAPDRVLEAALTTVNTTRQRHALTRLPWRFQNMNRFAGLAVAAIAALAVGAVALAVLFGTPPGVGTDPSPSPRATAAAPVGPTTGPTSAASARPALSETFTSMIHGASVAYPGAWTVVPATLPWDGSDFPSMASGTADIIYEKEDDSPFIALASLPLGGGSGDQWVDDFVATFTSRCAVPTEEVTIDGRRGVLVDVCRTAADGGRPLLAVASVADRGYLIYVYGAHDVAWFREILATVRLEPALAVDPIDGSGFRHPFTVWMPPGVGWDAVPIDNEAYAEFRIPGSGADGNASAVGVILRAIDGGRRDVCAETSEPLDLDGGPETVIDYIDLIGGVALTDERQTTVSGIPAQQAIVEFDAQANPGCAEPRPFAEQDGVEETEVLSHVPPEVGVRVTAFDIDGQHVVMWTWAETPDWYEVADELIAAIEFDTP